jgi:hypothetical protein
VSLRATPETEVWGVMLDVDGDDRRWFESHRGGARHFTKEHAQAMADTLNRGGMSGVCEARKLGPEESP